MEATPTHESSLDCPEISHFLPWALLEPYNHWLTPGGGDAVVFFFLSDWFAFGSNAPWGGEGWQKKQHRSHPAPKEQKKNLGHFLHICGLFPMNHPHAGGEKWPWFLEKWK